MIQTIVVVTIVIGVVIFIVGAIQNKSQAGNLSKIYEECGITFGTNEFWDIVEFSGTAIKSKSLGLEADIKSVKMPVTFDELKVKASQDIKQNVSIVEQSSLTKEVNGLSWNLIIQKAKLHNSETNQDVFGIIVYAYLFVPNYCIEVHYIFGEEDHINKMDNKYDVLLGCFKKKN
jgi:hypothetical protein